MQYDILIFVQASADLFYAMNLYEKNKEKIMHICVVNVKPIFEYAKSFHLQNTKLDFFPYVQMNIRNPRSIIKAKTELKQIWKKNFKSNDYQDIYFFSRFYDWFTASMIGNFIKQKRSEIYYIDHYDDISVKNDIIIKKHSLRYFKNLLGTQIVSFVAGVKYKPRYSTRFLEFNYWLYPIKKKSPSGQIVVNKALNINF